MSVRELKDVAMFARQIAILSVLLLVSAVSFTGPALALDKKVSSGKTQVVASVNGREVTLIELRMEMARLGLNPNEPYAEGKALKSLTDRVLIAEEARKAKMDKRPEALWRMEAAKEQALAEMYMGIVSQPAEPTQEDVETFILDNPTLFTAAKKYTFSVLDLEAGDFDLEVMTPLFDETSDFTKLEAYMKGQDIPYTISSAVRESSSFPEQIRLQLAEYTLGDNIVLQGDQQVSILKIINVSNAAITVLEGIPVARQLLKQEESRQRVENKLNELRGDARIKIFRQSAKLPAAENGEGE
jgi:EpsD family peptidyl-prolyl cis-trans isomerase